MTKSISDIMQICHIPTDSKIAILNDQFRQSLPSPHWHFTPIALPHWQELWLKIKNYSDFTPDNDPYGERDFGKIVLNGETYFWKIDYYDLNLTYHSPDPATPALTIRKITIMHASEY